MTFPYALTRWGLRTTLLLSPIGVAFAQAPVITAVIPMANTRAAARTSPVTVSFSQLLTAASAGALKVSSTQRGGLRTRDTTPATVSGNALSFAPTAYPFMPGETVQYTVTTAAASSGGALAQARVGQFTAAVGGTGRGSFTAPATNADPAVGNVASGLAVGDLDGDGDLDLLVGDYIDAIVRVYLNNGFGSFGASVSSPTVPVGGTPGGMALGDVDGDGDLDLLATDINVGRVNVRLNNGGGILSGGSNPAVGGHPFRLALGDVDGDGDPDLLTANFISGTNGTVSVRLNNGLGNFAAVAAAPDVAVGNRPSSLALGDVDDDGDLDLLTTNENSGTVSVRFNNGSGYFTSITPDLAMGPNPRSVVLGDVDGDGDLDFVTADGTTYAVSVRFNDGGGSFSARATTPDAMMGTVPTSIALGDIDADADLDLLVANATGTVSIGLNNGSGVFTRPATNATVAVGQAAKAVVQGDVDGDGDLDLLTVNGTNYAQVSVRLNSVAALATTRSQLSDGLAISPNPAHGRTTLTGAAPHAPLAVLDALGRVLLMATADATGTAQLRLPAGLPAGVYVVRGGGQALRLSVE